MNKTVLTLLGCSGSLGLMLAMTNLAVADTAKPNSTDAPETASLVDITFSAPKAHTASQATLLPRSISTQSANVDPASDTIGDLVIAKFRCDCNACRVAVVQLLQTGQLSL